MSIEPTLVDKDVSDNQMPTNSTPLASNILSNEVAASIPTSKDKLIVKVYGLIGYTRYIDLQFDSEHVVPENIFVFENKRYKIASVIEMKAGEYAVNAVSVEYST
ncbi:hypothetical protein WDW89_00535 [Deltaproteobacteria bacterium TL4]